eukprot:SAG22_NODE_7_length_40155_cov_25.241356_28_plen_251_part_00
MQLSAFVPFGAHLAEQRVRLVFVGSGTPAQAQQYLGALKLAELPGELLMDPSPCPVYQAFGLRKSVWASLVPSITNGIATHGVSAAAEGIRLGWKNAAFAGDSWQQGGTFVLDHQTGGGGGGGGSGGDGDGGGGPDGTARAGGCLFAHHERYPGDWLPVEEVFSAGGIALPKATANVRDTSYAAALRWYLALPEKEAAGAGAGRPAFDWRQKAPVLAAGLVFVFVLLAAVLGPMLMLSKSQGGGDDTGEL